MTAFRARARAVDMLGRQQIANLPTALSELYKNAHDAYATAAIADFYRAHNLLVVSDDGVGMDGETFEQSWLTIATESKLESDSTPRPAGMSARVQLGEKGIGRFAIGALGSQVMVVSKRDRCRAVAALVNWKMFELPQIDLDEVPVGLLELDGELTAADVARLKAPLAEAVNRFRLRNDAKKQSRLLDDIQAALDALPDDPHRAVPELGLLGATGTMFLISSVSEDLAAEIGAPGSEDASMFERTLHGFTDSWLGDASTPDFAVDFVDHRGGGDVESLLQPDDFFGPADFNRADHHIHGEFDQGGDFFGTIRIFDEEATDLEVRCPDSLRPRCGPFSFEVGVVQGMARESRLDPEAFGAMNAKLRRLGGLYVYMDGIRVQPYGRPDVDYLEIEERRSLGAGYYFFSYRRMFGAVGLTSEQNPGLQEKAGREGFTRSRSYSDFRELLINLLKQLAATYFRAEAPQVRAYERGRERLVREDKLRKERERRAAAGRKRLRSELASAVQYLTETDYQERASEIVEDLSTQLAAADRLQPATRQVAEARRALRQLVEPLEFDEPEGFAASGPMRPGHDAGRARRGGRRGVICTASPRACRRLGRGDGGTLGRPGGRRAGAKTVRPGEDRDGSTTGGRSRSRSQPCPSGDEQPGKISCPDAASGLRQALGGDHPADRVGEHGLDARAVRLRAGIGLDYIRHSPGAHASHEPHSSQRPRVHQQRPDPDRSRGGRGC